MLIVRVGGKPLRRLNTTEIGNHAAAEIERTLTVIDHHLRAVGILERSQSLLRGEGLHERSNLSLGDFETGLDGLQLLGLNERLVALDVDNHIVVLADALVSLLHTVGAALVVDTRHDGLAAKRLHSIVDALVVGSHNSIIQLSFHLSIDSLNDCLSTQQGQRLGRETGGGIASRDNADKSHLSVYFFAL